MDIKNRQKVLNIYKELLISSRQEIDNFRRNNDCITLDEIKVIIRSKVIAVISNFDFIMKYREEDESFKNSDTRDIAKRLEKMKEDLSAVSNKIANKYPWNIITARIYTDMVNSKDNSFAMGSDLDIGKVLNYLIFSLSENDYRSALYALSEDEIRYIDFDEDKLSSAKKKTLYYYLRSKKDSLDGERLKLAMNSEFNKVSGIRFFESQEDEERYNKVVELSRICENWIEKIDTIDSEKE